MKKIILPLVVCAAGLFASSCSQSLLDIDQKGVIPEEAFYITDEDAESALTAMYHGFITNMCSIKQGKVYNSWLLALNLPGDDCFAAGKEYGNNETQVILDEFRFDPSSEIISNLYKDIYLTNYYCNLITDHFQYGESAIKDNVISQARVMRAWLHMVLAISWGTPPLVDHVLVGADKPSNYEGGQKGLLEWCAKECEESRSYLAVRKGADDKEAAVIITQGFADAVQGKSLIFAGEYDKAMTPLKRVIDSKAYSLVPGEELQKMFHIEGDGNAEKIFEGSIVDNVNLSLFTQYFRSTWQHANMWCWRGDRFQAVPAEVGMRSNGWGGLAVRPDFAEAFIENDGDSYRRKYSIISYEEVLTELTYPNDAGMTKEDKMKDPNRGLKDIRGLYYNCEYLQFKRIVSAEDVAGHSTWSAANFPIMRYAEVLLMYAECCAQTGKDTAGGLDAILAIQKRAGIPEANYAKSLTMDVVKKEKLFELFTEGSRYPDCVRWGDTAGMEISGKSIPTLYDHMIDPDESTRTNYHSPYVIYRDYNGEAGTKVGFQKGKHELFPFPNLETSINPNIVQNPGW